MRNKIIKSLFFISVLSVASCTNFNINPDKTIKVTGVRLNEHNLTLYVGDSYSFSATVEPDDATNKNVTWSISNSSIGSITSNGEFEAVGAGNTTVIVSTKNGGFTDSCEVRINAVPDKVIDHISATSSVLVYEVDDVFDRNTLVFTAFYTDDYYEPEVLSGVRFDVQFQPFDSPGQKIVNGAVYIDDHPYEFEFYVTVIDSGGGGQTNLTLTVNAFNDFHGAIYPEGNRMGLAALGTFLKEQSKKPNTVSLSQGDDWQGSIYSNYNRGRLVNDVYAYARLNARTVGNHDFDWGVDPLKTNTATAYDGYTTPVLAANVYDYDFATKTSGDVQQSSIGVPTVTYTMENGLKVGIVGIIGEDQITSITSSYTETICFKPHINIIKQYATELRQAGCSIVIATCHTGQESVLGNELEKYVDLVLCGHTHRNENETENGLHYYQFGAYGTYIGQISMEYNVSTHKVSVTGCTSITSYTVSDYYDQLDSNIVNLINTYGTSCNQEADEVLANSVSGYFASKSNAVNLMCKAVYEQAVAEGHKDVLLAYCNDARANLPSGSWTYADLYESFPFDNAVYIESVKGRDILNEVPNYNCAYFNPSLGSDTISINPNSYYKIAVLDYLLFHTNSSRAYNYFYYFDGHPDAELSLNYRHILRKWLKDNHYNAGTTIYSSDYSSSNYQFNTSRIQTA